MAMKLMAGCASTQEFPVDVPEQRRARLAQPFEDHHLARHDPHAFVAQAQQGYVAIERPPRADGIGDHVDLLAVLQQLEGGLQHAHVRLGADQHDLRAVAARQARHALRSDAGEVVLGRDRTRGYEVAYARD
jgi:hypothetical protein